MAATNVSLMRALGDRRGATIEDIASDVNVVIWTLLGFSTSIMVLRMYSKWSYKGSRLRDDIIMYTGWVTLLAASITTTIAVNAARTISSVAELEHDTTVLIAAGAVSAVAVCLPRISVGMMLVEALAVSSTWKAILLLVPSILTLMMGIAVAIASGIECNPRSAQWGTELWPGAKCEAVVNFTSFASIFSICVDLLYAVTSASLVFRINMQIRRKILASILMLCSVIAAAVSAYKSVLFQLLKDGRPTIEESLVGEIEGILWTMVEANVLLMTACVPSLSPLRRIFKKKQPITDFTDISPAEAGLKPLHMDGSPDRFTRKRVRIHSEKRDISDRVNRYQPHTTASMFGNMESSEGDTESGDGLSEVDLHEEKQADQHLSRT